MLASPRMWYFGLMSSWVMTSHGPTPQPQGRKSQGTGTLLLAQPWALQQHLVTWHPLPQHQSESLKFLTNHRNSDSCYWRDWDKHD